jgi:hypothetical protein
MLTLFSGIAFLGITIWLLLTAWLSQSRFAWQYNIWAMLVVLLWAQPWSRSDPYRTDQRLVRGIFYILLFLADFGFWYLFGGLWPVILAVEVLVLLLIEITGRPIIERE